MSTSEKQKVLLIADSRQGELAKMLRFGNVSIVQQQESVISVRPSNAIVEVAISPNQSKERSGSASNGMQSFLNQKLSRGAKHGLSYQRGKIKGR